MSRVRPPLMVLGFALFILLGMPEGVLGTAWPSIREEVGRPVSDLAWLVAAYTLGYLVSATGSGHLIQRFGVDRSIRSGVAVTAAGLGLYAMTSGWATVFAAALVSGLGAGTVDAALNTHFAVAGDMTAMNYLHAFFGVGATLGPLVVAGLLAAHRSWHLAYGLMGAVEVVLLVVLLSRRSRFGPRVPPAGGERRTGPEPPSRRMLLWLTMLVFFTYVGAEVAYGQWSFSLLTEERGVSEQVAALVVAAYWGGLTVGRIGLAISGRRLEPRAVLRRSGAVVVAAGALFWLDPFPGADLVALPLVGLGEAGIFPAMVMLNPGWFGVAGTPRAVGYQLASSSLGAILVSGAVGNLAGSRGLGTMPATVLAVAIASLVAVRSTVALDRPVA